jgi:hypothetical protein
MNAKGYAIIILCVAIVMGFCIQLWSWNREAKETYGGMLVQDQRGNLYLIEHNIGHTFYIKPVPQWQAIDAAKGVGQ